MKRKKNISINKSRNCRSRTLWPFMTSTSDWSFATTLNTKFVATNIWQQYLHVTSDVSLIKCSCKTIFNSWHFDSFPVFFSFIYCNWIKALRKGESRIEYLNNIIGYWTFHFHAAGKVLTKLMLRCSCQYFNFHWAANVAAGVESQRRRKTNKKLVQVSDNCTITIEYTHNWKAIWRLENFFFWFVRLARDFWQWEKNKFSGIVKRWSEHIFTHNWRRKIKRKNELIKIKYLITYIVSFCYFFSAAVSICCLEYLIFLFDDESSFWQLTEYAILMKLLEMSMPTTA